MQPLSLRPDELPEEREKVRAGGFARERVHGRRGVRWAQSECSPIVPVLRAGGATQVTDADIEEHLRKKQEDERKAAEGSALGGFAGGGGGGNKPAAGGAVGGKAAPGGAAAAGAAAGAKGASPAPAEHHGAAAAAATVGDDPLSRMMAAVPLTDLERQLQAWHRRRLQQQKARLLSEIDEMAGAFDGALTQLRREKFRLEKELKQCEMRQLVHAQEYTLLQDFDKREVVLIQKRAARLEDRNVSRGAGAAGRAPPGGRAGAAYRTPPWQQFGLTQPLSLALASPCTCGAQEILEKISECSSKLEVKRTELEGLMARRCGAARVATRDVRGRRTQGWPKCVPAASSARASR